MRMISEQVKSLRKLANQWKHNDVAGCNLIFEAADTIEALSEKVRANTIYGDWIPVSERLPSKEGSYLITSETGAVTTAHWYMPSEWKPDGFWGRKGEKDNLCKRI